MAKTHKDDPMLFYFTSGTTGYPKMVVHTHSYARGHVVTGKFWLDLNKGLEPLGHRMGKSRVEQLLRPPWDRRNPVRA